VFVCVRAASVGSSGSENPTAVRHVGRAASISASHRSSLFSSLFLSRLGSRPPASASDVVSADASPAPGSEHAIASASAASSGETSRGAKKPCHATFRALTHRGCKNRRSGHNGSRERTFSFFVAPAERFPAASDRDPREHPRTTAFASLREAIVSDNKGASFGVAPVSFPFRSSFSSDAEATSSSRSRPSIDASSPLRYRSTHRRSMTDRAAVRIKYCAFSSSRPVASRAERRSSRSTLRCAPGAGSMQAPSSPASPAFAATRRRHALARRFREAAASIASLGSGGDKPHASLPPASASSKCHSSSGSRDASRGMKTNAATSSDRSLCGKRARIPSSLIPGPIVALAERAVAARLGRGRGRGEGDGTAVAAARMSALMLATFSRTTRGPSGVTLTDRFNKPNAFSLRVRLNTHTFTLFLGPPNSVFRGETLLSTNKPRRVKGAPAARPSPFYSRAVRT